MMAAQSVSQLDRNFQEWTYRPFLKVRHFFCFISDFQNILDASVMTSLLHGGIHHEYPYCQNPC